MAYKLFIDDERFPAENSGNWLIARSFDDVMQIISQEGLPSYISFDHDLGSDLSGYDIAKWLCAYIEKHNLNITFDYYVHSQNPIGKENITRYLENFRKHYS